MKKDERTVILHIDTSDNKQTKIGLTVEGEKHVITKVHDNRKSQIVLPLILELLDKHTVRIHDVTAIKVHEGPGSFTGLRVGVAIANALGSVLQIPINGRQIGEQVEPHYS